jgi:hypothetical protein
MPSGTVILAQFGVLGALYAAVRGGVIRWVLNGSSARRMRDAGALVEHQVGVLAIVRTQWP